MTQVFGRLDDGGPMFRGDFVSPDPTLNRGVALVTKRSRDRPDSSKLRQNFGMGFHNPMPVRCQRTYVNLECVRPLSENGVMVGPPTIGQQLVALKNRVGMTLDAIAESAGYSGRSSIQRYFHPDYDSERLPFEVARKLAKALAGKGDPVISDAEVLALAGLVETQPISVFNVPQDLERPGRLPTDIPIYGTALAGNLRAESSDGTKRVNVEQAELNATEVLGYRRRPSALQGQDAVYGIYVAGMSMFPRFSDGEPALVDPKRPPRIGDDVVVQLKSPDEHQGERIDRVLIKRLSRRNTDFIELEQFNPALTFRVATGQVASIHRIITLDDLL